MAIPPRLPERRIQEHFETQQTQQIIRPARTRADASAETFQSLEHFSPGLRKGYGCLCARSRSDRHRFGRESGRESDCEIGQDALG